MHEQVAVAHAGGGGAAAAAEAGQPENRGEPGAAAEIFRGGGRLGQARDRDDETAAFHRLERALERVAADEVEGAVLIADDGLETRRRVVDDDGRAEPADERFTAGGGGGGDLGAEEARELERERPDAAGAARNEDAEALA